MKKHDEYEILEGAHEAAGLHMMQKSPRADELITCLEGEIAKRDVEIVELELEVALRDQALDRHAEYGKQLRAELSALKSQEPVAYIPVDRETGEEWHPVLKKGSGNICDYKPLYAAPVSEAKAQEPVLPCELDLESSFSCAEKEASLHAGVRDTFYFALIECLQKNKLYRAPAQKELSVVMPERKKAHNCEGIEFWKANGWNDCLDELASIYAAPVSEAKAQGVVMPERQDDQYGDQDAIGWNACIDEVARLNAAPVQQVSVPVHWTGCHDADIALNLLDRIDAPDDEDRISQLEQIVMRMGKQFVNSAMLAVAPAAPAADAGLVEALEHARLFIVNGIDLGFIQMPEAGTPDPAHETLPMIDAALAAHRAKGGAKC